MNYFLFLYLELIIVNRLQGLDYDDAYASTPQIEVTNIPWHYKGKYIYIIYKFFSVLIFLFIFVFLFVILFIRIIYFKNRLQRYS